MTVDADHARAFLAVATMLHFGRAAEQLHIAQPALSRSIAALERELGARLFERTTRDVRLSSAGQALLQPARELVRATDDVRMAARAALRGEIGHVGVAYSGASTHLMVGRLAQRVRQEHPGVTLELFSASFANETVAAVLRGDADIGLGRWDRTPAGVGIKTVGTEHLVVAVPADHPLAEMTAVTMRQLRDDVFVSLPPHDGSVLVSRLRELSAAAGFVARTVQYAPDSWILISLVGAGIGCSLTVSSVAANVHHPNVRYPRLLDDIAPIKLRMVWRIDPGPASGAVLSLAKQLWTESDAAS